MTHFRCSECGDAYPDKVVHLCPNCGGVFDIANSLNYKSSRVMHNLSGIWKYYHSLGLPIGAPMITLGEGNTPLVEARLFGKDVYLKLESLNPTGSFKDRLTAPQISYLISQGVTEAVEDSSGNAGASFAAYAARAGIAGTVYIPSSASGPKRAQIEKYGANVVAVPGPRSAATEAVLKDVNDGAVYASHAYLPFGLAGIASIAYEILDQLGGPPGVVIAPVGHGSLLLGIVYGFMALEKAGDIERLPDIIGVQAKACAPIWRHDQFGAVQSGEMEEGETAAGGIRVIRPVRGKKLLELAEEEIVRFLAVEEDAIIAGRDHLASLGFYVETTSAVVWNALAQVVESVSGPIVLVISGSGLKNELV